MSEIKDHSFAFSETIRRVRIAVIAVIITCFNRKALTLDIVAKFAKYSQAFDLYIADGGSTDGTRDLLNSACREFPNISLILLEDSYWAESMRKAWEVAVSADVYDGYLLLNDDLHIENARIVEFLEELKNFENNEIRVGQCLDESKSKITYGGLVRKPVKSRIHFKIALAEDELVTFNGNFVYIPKFVVSEIGILSSRFSHSFADIDYGLRASKRNIPIRLIPNPVGITNYNTAWSESLFNLTAQNWRRKLFNPKGIPVSEWFYFCYSHGGILWPANFILRYLKLFYLNAKRSEMNQSKI